MKHFKFSLIITAILLMSVRCYSDDFNNAMIKAKANLKTALDTYDEKALVKSRGEFERILQLKKEQWIVYYYMSLVDYSLANTGMKNQEKEKIKKFTESGFAMLDKCLEIKANFGDAYVLKMALTFNRWVYEQEKMQEIIDASKEADEAAKKADPENPRYYLMTGISNYYMPEAFGGGMNAAIKNFDKSLELFQTRKEKEEYYPDWGRDLLYGYLAMAYIKRNDDGDLAKAKTYLDKGLEYNPTSGFLKTNVQKDYDEKVKEK